MKRIDEKQIDFLNDYLLKNYDWITSAWTDSEETFGWDSYITTSAGTKYGIELKTAQNHTLMDGDTINEYFNIECTTGLCRNFRYCYIPNKDEELENIFCEYYDSIDTNSLEDYDEDCTPMPEEYKGKNVWIVNASIIMQGTEIVMSNKSKWYKLMSGQNMLILMAQDGLMIFTPKAIRKAFMGYARMKCKHTNNANAVTKDFNVYYEVKALLDMNFAKYVPINIDKEILKNN